MTEATTTPAKYIFLDVVGFTHGRSVEAQSDIVLVLNDIVQTSLDEYNVPKDQLILLPTGDGMCIAMLNIESPYDAHLLVALALIRRLHEFNESIEDETRRFQVRIGLNANVDNLVKDINGNRNIAGAGISMASRVMNMADGNQILVGESVFDTLRYRERYMSSFKHYPATVKHGVQIPVYQFVEEGHAGLNTDIPQKFRIPERVEPNLDKLVAFYFAHAIGNRTFLLQRRNESDKGVVALYLLAKDSEEKAKAAENNRSIVSLYVAEEAATIERLFDKYEKIDVTVLSELAGFIISKHLSEYRSCFERSVFHQYQLINNKGIEKLKTEWPNIFADFVLVSHA
jgi:class 3 adenylate cyclase